MNSRKLMFLKIWLIATLCSLSFSQNLKFEINDFIKRTRLKYYQTELGAEQIISKVSSSAFLNYVKSKTNDVVDAPLIIDWGNKNSITVKHSNYDLDVKDFVQERDNLKKVVQGLLVSWSAFFVEKQIPTAAMNFNFEHSKDKVYFSYISQSGKEFTRISKEFGLNGKLLKVRIQPSSGQQIILEPSYKNIAGKFLCRGWFYQKLDKSGNILEGMTVQLKSKVIEGGFFPETIQIDVQSSKEKYMSYRQLLVFTDYTLNDVPVE